MAGGGHMHYRPTISGADTTPDGAQVNGPGPQAVAPEADIGICHLVGRCFPVGGAALEEERETPAREVLTDDPPSRGP
ncbi:hypothetical protein GCM10023259_040860 [Thermocatellispora tengchongensis]